MNQYASEALDKAIPELIDEAKKTFADIHKASEYIWHIEAALNDMKVRYEFDYLFDEENLRGDRIFKKYIGWLQCDKTKTFGVMLKYVAAIAGHETIARFESLLETDFELRIECDKHLLGFVEAFTNHLKELKED